MEQKDIWTELSDKISIEEIGNSYKQPQCFHIKLKGIIENLLKDRRWNRIIEVGSQFWINSFVLDDNMSKTLLDLDSIAINKAKQVFFKMWKSAEFVVADMFSMPFENEKFDIVFNAWVLEHFSSDYIIKALMEYKRILKNNGFIVIAIPNHYSFVYRSAYLLLNIIKKWSYPKEYKIYDLRKEIVSSWLVLVERIVVCKENVFDFWWKFGFLFKFLDKIFNFQWYLTVLIIKKDL